MICSARCVARSAQLPAIGRRLGKGVRCIDSPAEVLDADFLRGSAENVVDTYAGIARSTMNPWWAVAIRMP